MTLDVARLISGFSFRELPPEDLSLALAVRRSVYVDELGYRDARILADPLDHGARHFLATTRDGKAVAAMRMLTSERRPFEFEQLLDVRTLPIKDEAAEISRNCVLAEYRAVTRSQMVHLGMWKLVHDCAVRSHLTELWAWAIPRIARIYEYVGFRNVPNRSFEHPLFGFQSYQLMRLDMLSLEDEYRKIRHPLADFLFGSRSHPTGP